MHNRAHCVTIAARDFSLWPNFLVEKFVSRGKSCRIQDLLSSFGSFWFGDNAQGRNLGV